MRRRRRSHGEGSLEHLPSGKWRACRTIGRSAEGKQVRERRTFDRQEDARAWLRQIADERRGEWARRTLAEWLAKWIADKSTEAEPATVKYYQDRINRRIVKPLGTIKLGDLSAMNVREWMVAMSTDGASAHERHSALKTLRAALRSAIDAGQISRNAAKEGAKLPKLKARTFQAWTSDQVAAFLKAAETSDLEAYWWLALDTGMRPGELFGLHWPAVDLKRQTVHVRQALDWTIGETPRLKEPKTAAGIRSLPITAATVDKLKEHREEARKKRRDVTDGPVFLNRHGSWLWVGYVGDRLKALCAKAGIPKIRLYDLRHTSATLLLGADVNIKVVSQRLGHNDIAITLRHYAGFLPSMQERAIQAMTEILSAQKNPLEGEQKNMPNSPK